MNGLHYDDNLYSPAPAGTTLSAYPALFQAQDLSDGSGGILTSSAVTFEPFDYVEVVKSALKFTSFSDDWYHRIHIIPNAVDLLNVVSDQSRPVILWNAFFVNKPLTATIFPTGDISIISPVEVPYMILPLEVLTYSLSVTEIGSPTIDELLIWVIDDEQFEVPVVGRRVIVWPFEPNWNASYTEDLEWMTDIITSHSGKEQRSQIRSKPRRFYEFNSLLTKEFAAQSANLLWGWQNRMYGLPLWHDRTIVASLLAATSLTITVDSTSGKGFFTGGLAILFNDPLDYEVVEILSFTTTIITLKTQVIRTWSINTKIYPINIGRFPATIPYVRMTDEITTVTTMFNVDPVQNDPFIPVVTAPLTYNGHEVVLKKPNWAIPINVDNNFESDIVDFSTGAISGLPTVDYARVIRRFQWMLKSKQEILDLRALLGRIKGRAKAIYLPTWFSDFKLYSTETASSTVIRVLDNEFYKMVGVNSALNVLMIDTISLDPIFRTITDVTLNVGGYVILTLNAPIGADLNTSTDPRLSLVHLCRMTADRVKIVRLTDSAATVEANFTLVNQ